MKAYCQFCDKTVEPIVVPTLLHGYNKLTKHYYRRNMLLCPTCGGNVPAHTKRAKHPVSGPIETIPAASGGRFGRVTHAT